MPFKKFGLEISNPNLPPIRVWWSKFVDTLKVHHERMGDKVVLIEAQRWMFDVSLVDRYSPDVAYIPHVEKHNFEGGDNCMYYMQTVVPWMFTIDPQGWAGGGSFVGEDFDTDQLARWMISTRRESARCLYENEDILVEHRISIYSDGERSATMLVHLKKDVLLWRT